MVGLAVPTFMALDAEMVLRLACQGAVARAGFENALRKRDGGRNLMLAHLAHGDVFVGLDVFLGRDALRGESQRSQQQK